MRSNRTVDKGIKRARLKEALDAVERDLGGEVVVYNGPISEDGLGLFVSKATQISSDKKLILAIVTYGGIADSAYRIARYAQNYFKDFVLFIPSDCKSAGTLIALGASKIYMSPFGELGPLDVQVLKHDEIFERRSGLLSKSALWTLTEESFRTFEEILISLRNRSAGTIGFKLSSQVAANITTGLMSPIASQIDPLSMGEDYQNLQIAKHYGDRLIERFKTVHPSAVTALVNEYPSHNFVIDLFEARQLLGNAELATPGLMAIVGAMGADIQRPNIRDVVVSRLRDEVEAGDEASDSGRAIPDNAGGSDSTTGSDRPNGGGNRGGDSGAGKKRGPRSIAEGATSPSAAPDGAAEGPT